jgi:hypothetical protein
VILGLRAPVFTGQLGNALRDVTNELQRNTQLEAEIGATSRELLDLPANLRGVVVEVDETANRPHATTEPQRSLAVAEQRSQKERETLRSHDHYFVQTCSNDPPQRLLTN